MLEVQTAFAEEPGRRSHSLRVFQRELERLGERRQLVRVSERGVVVATDQIQPASALDVLLQRALDRRLRGERLEQRPALLFPRVVRR